LLKAPLGSCAKLMGHANGQTDVSNQLKNDEAEKGATATAEPRPVKTVEKALMVTTNMIADIVHPRLMVCGMQQLLVARARESAG
jgi:hypothetical protein